MIMSWSITGDRLTRGMFVIDARRATNVDELQISYVDWRRDGTVHVVFIDGWAHDYAPEDRVMVLAHDNSNVLPTLTEAQAWWQRNRRRSAER
jgi:hypothetical protein